MTGWMNEGGWSAPSSGGGGGGGGGYVGPAEVAGWSGPYGVWSLRAATAALASSGVPLVDVCDVSLANTQTINALSTGGMDLAAVATWVAAHGPNVYVKKIYDQIGTQHFLSLGSVPTKLLTSGFGLNTKPVLLFDQLVSQNCFVTGSTAVTRAQPLTYGLCYETPSTQTSPSAIFTAGGFVVPGLFDMGTSDLRMQADSAGSLRIDLNSLPYDTWNGTACVFDGAASILRVNAASVTGNVGTEGIGSDALCLGTSIPGGATFAHMHWWEQIIHPSAVTDANCQLLIANQKTWGGF